MLSSLLVLSSTVKSLAFQVVFLRCSTIPITLWCVIYSLLKATLAVLSDNRVLYGFTVFRVNCKSRHSKLRSNQQDLGSDEDVIAWNEFAVDEVVECLAQCIFRIIKSRCVKMAISNFNCWFDSCHRFRPAALNNMYKASSHDELVTSQNHLKVKSSEWICHILL